LQSIGKGLATELAEEQPSDEMAIMQFLERATEHYGRLWRECSEDEQFALTQLASDGLLNPANTAAIGQLLKRGLVVREPQFRIMNESFRRFVAAAPAAELKERWQDESRASGWGKARGVFATVTILAAIFLLTTQNGLWQSAAAYVTTAIGGLGTLLKLFHTVQGEKAS
jgi:hypothetical protein